MSSVHTDVSLEQATRRRDISSWKEGELDELSQKARKRYLKRKAAITAYFTTGDSIEDIASRYHLSPQFLEKLAQQCLMQHRDGEVWGFRALQPRVRVIDYAPDTPRPEGDDDEVDTGKREAVRHAGEPSEASGGVDVDMLAATEQVIAPDDTSPAGARSDLEANDEPAQEDARSIEHESDTADNVSEQSSDPPAKQGIDTVVAGEEQSEPPQGGRVEAAGEAGTLDSPPPETSLVPEMPSTLEDEVTGIAAQETGAETEGSHDDAFVLLNAVDKAEETGGEAVSSFEHAADDEPAPSSDEACGAAALAPLQLPLVAREEITPARQNGAVAASISAHRFPAMMRSRAQRPAMAGKPHARAAAKKRIIQVQRSVRRRWLRHGEQARRRQVRRLISAVVLGMMLLMLLIPLGIGIGAYSAYTSIRSTALDGVNHLLTVKELLPVSKSDPTAALNPDKLQQARVEFEKARADFLQLQSLVTRPEVQDALAQFAPQYVNQLGTARRLIQVGIDISQMGNELLGVALLGAHILHGSPLAAGTTRPLITVSDVNNIEGTLVHALYYISDIRLQMSQVSLKDLPISNTQKKELGSALALLPQAESMIKQAQGLVGAVAWLLGVDGKRRFLVQTMDRAELRPGGGFTGQYGVLEIQNGRMAPFSLQDVTELDYNSNGTELGRQAPPAYRNWMNFGNWGVRDSNVSGDFPTDAQFAMQLFQEEGGGPVDGDIAFTPTVVEHILAVPGVGSIYVKEYNETITAQNLEDKLHYYQQDPQAIRLQQQKTGTHNAATRKAFTTLLGKLLLDKVRHLPVKTLLKVAQNAVKDIQSHDLEIYFTNPQAEAWLVEHGFSNAMSTFTKTDGFMVVQANISISKASQYVHTDYQDNVVLDSQGGATHNLTITLDYQKRGEVWGQNTYADYIRVYAPANAQLLGGSGFDSGHALCTPPKSPTGTGGTGTGTGGTGGTGGTATPPPPSGCSQYDHYFPDSGRYCPNGNYNLSGPNSFVPGKGFGPWPVDSLGGPTALVSDTPGRAMWGGLTETPMNCISTITLTWYVPNAVKHTPGQPVYQMLVEKQGGYVPGIEITIDASQLKGVKSYSFKGDLVADRIFALAIVPWKKSGK